MARDRRAVVVALGAATALSMGGDMLLYTVLPTEAAGLGIGVAALGVILSIHRFIRLVANSAVGMIADRFGRRRPFLWGTALALASTLGYLLADGFWPLLAARLVWGVAFALILVSAYSIVLDVTSHDDRGRMVGWYQSLVAVGTMIALVMSGVLADRVGYRAALATFTPFAALAWLIAYLTVHETRPVRGAHAPGASVLQTYRGVDRRLLWPGYVSFATFFAGNGVLMATLGLHLQAELAGGGPAALAVPLATITGVLLAARKLATIVAAPIAGVLSDQVGDRRGVAAAGVLAGIAGFAVLAGGGGIAVIATGVVLTALGEGIVLPPLTAWAGDLTPPSLRGVVMGGFATANDLGGAVGPLVGYAIGAAAGLRPAYALCAIVFLSALAALAAAGPDPRRLRLAQARD
ncbi:MAG TPA: MFS transporter [Candidatus Limnocylindria bacterium]|nr:MFS transporter [Candidatus Limnocylindria bacterium]